MAPLLAHGISAAEGLLPVRGHGADAAPLSPVPVSPAPLKLSLSPPKKRGRMRAVRLPDTGRGARAQQGETIKPMNEQGIPGPNQSEKPPPPMADQQREEGQGEEQEFHCPQMAVQQ
ncbi:hypothetical protein NDU88_006087 [Pleurodeles waltl]|uniref:Uncharacterized protein n=1 Tax=Pleurodeles waltl TaxID=8319 RepID=A0AAV7WWK2_PLEWA|nr:hypothetical protein NDU88_006087 [Pleurodeles waltl]